MRARSGSPSLRGRRWRSPAALAFAIAATTAAVAAPEGEAGEPEALVAGYACAGILDHETVQGVFVEWRSRASWREFRPWAGASIGSQGPYFVGAGVLRHLDLGPRWRLTLSFGPGFYESNDHFELGSHLEFLSTVEVSWRLRGRQRVCLSAGHISNGSVGRVNPGSEFVKLGWQIPLRSLPGTSRARRTHAGPAN